MTRAEVASNAAGWLKDKARLFKGLEVKILNLQHRAAVARSKLPKGSDENAAALVVVQRIGTLLETHQRLLNQLDRLTPHIPALQNPTLGLIAVPIAWALATIALAGAMAALFRRVTAEERAVRLLERGDITTAEAIELVEGLEGRAPLFGGFPPWVLPAAAVAAGVYFYNQTSR